MTEVIAVFGAAVIGTAIGYSLATALFWVLQ